MEKRAWKWWVLAIIYIIILKYTTFSVCNKTLSLTQQKLDQFFRFFLEEFDHTVETPILQRTSEWLSL